MSVSELPFTRFKEVLFSVIFVTSIVAFSTTTVQEAFCPLCVVAVITVVPTFIPVTTPSATVATVGTLEVHVILSFESSGCIVAISVNTEPFSTVAVFWLSLIDVAATLTLTVHLAIFPFEVVAVMLVCPADNAVTLPLPSIFATSELLET